MILADTSVWVDHLHRSDAGLVDLLEREQVLMHPHVMGELALGRIPQRQRVLAALRGLPEAIVATDAEVFDFIALNELIGLGIGYVDAHLLAATRLTATARLWTRDRRLLSAARRLGLDANIEPFAGFQE